MSSTAPKNIESILQASSTAFQKFKSANVQKRAQLMRAIADEIEKLGEELIETTHVETHLPTARLNGEKGRTIHQWRLYADAIESGMVLDLRIDTALTGRNPPRVDIRKMMAPLGPIVIFGSSNFPYAFSTAGGDSASAIAAGNSVIVKVHPAHPKTSKIMTNAIRTAITKEGYDPDLFIEVEGGIETGTALVNHSTVKAVGFTGSYQGGKALYDLANKRKDPIPVFAEMGSINPLFLMPEKLKSNQSELAAQYVDSLTLGSGQFCTNPGVLIAIKSDGLQQFKEAAIKAVQEKPAGKMLHAGIAASYNGNVSAMIEHPAITVIAKGQEGEDHTGQAILALTSAKEFLANEHFCGEVFGPFGLIVECENFEEMIRIADGLEGQLTSTLLATEEELETYSNLISIIREKCGRIIFNNFPTGVEVCVAMHHGGPFPSTTDSRFTSVGSDAIKRFLRPVTYQNWPQSLLPDELKNENPLHVWRTVNGVITKNNV